MKQWNKPVVKVVIIDEVLVCSTSISVAPGVKGEGAQKGRGTGAWTVE